MTALADADQLQAVMRRQMTEEDVQRATILLDIASDMVRTYSGVRFTQETTTARVKVRNGRARLPQAPVTAVTSVKDMSAVTVSHEWYAGQIIDCNPTLLNGFEINLRRNAPQYVDIVYTHGYETIPSDVAGMVCDMVAEALDAPPEETGTQHETLGPWSITNGSQFPGGLRLTQSRKDRLLPYMSPAGTASTS